MPKPKDVRREFAPLLDELNEKVSALTDDLARPHDYRTLDAFNQLLAVLRNIDDRLAALEAHQIRYN